LFAIVIEPLNLKYVLFQQGKQLKRSKALFYEVMMRKEHDFDKIKGCRIAFYVDRGPGAAFPKTPFSFHRFFSPLSHCAPGK
jgi:hypothetical protein